MKSCFFVTNTNPLVCWEVNIEQDYSFRRLSTFALLSLENIVSLWTWLATYSVCFDGVMSGLVEPLKSKNDNSNAAAKYEEHDGNESW